MQIVIDIPKEDWEFIKGSDGCRWSRAIIEGVINGVLLPKGHGRLIDAGEATRSCLEHTGKRSLLIDLAPTVIEADVTDMNVGKKEEENGKEDQMV